DCNGCQDDGERGVRGVKVFLYEGCPAGDEIGTTFTDDTGYYEFCELLPGDYTVRFEAPAGYEFSPQFACGFETDSNAGEDGMTDCITIVDADDWTIDAGLCLPPQDGCTLTIGKWKNWTGFGPQEDLVSQYLPVYLGDMGGAKTLDVTTAAIAVDVLEMKTYGKNNNGITKLYAQLLAAKLNFAAGASDGDVADYVTDADAFLADHDWTDWDGLSQEDKDMVMMWQGSFDAYNNGDIGPGHCEDDDDEEPVMFK
ncbi:MAG: SdrD B-like domain-containing protein, partial [Candidatus Krumholzibacteriota bacterium]